MAFLLSPKTGGGVTYVFISNFPVSINGGAAQEYTQDAPGTVAPGDVISRTNGGSALCTYYGSGGASIESDRTALPYEIELVPGAVRVECLLELA